MAQRLDRFKDWVRRSDTPSDLPGLVYGAAWYAFGVLGFLHLVVGNPDAVFAGVGWAVVVVWTLGTAGYVLYTQYWRRWIFWRTDHRSPSRPMTRLSELAIVVMTVGALFAAINCMFVVEGWNHVDGTVPRGRLVVYSCEYFAWHLLDAVPVLDLTGSFGLQPNVRFTGVGNGILLVAFKALLIGPTVGLLASILQPHRIPAVVAVDKPHS